MYTEYMLMVGDWCCSHHLTTPSNHNSQSRKVTNMTDSPHSFGRGLRTYMGVTPSESWNTVTDLKLHNDSTFRDYSSQSLSQVCNTVSCFPGKVCLPWYTRAPAVILLP